MRTPSPCIVDEVLAANPDKVDQYRAGKTGLFGFFVGQVIRSSQAKPTLRSYSSSLTPDSATGDNARENKRNSPRGRRSAPPMRPGQGRRYHRHVLTRQPLRPVTDAEVETFWRDGVVCLRQVIGSEWLERMDVPVEEALATAATTDLSAMGDELERAGAVRTVDEEVRGQARPAATSWRAPTTGAVNPSSSTSPYAPRWSDRGAAAAQRQGVVLRGQRARKRAGLPRTHGVPPGHGLLPSRR